MAFSQSLQKGQIPVYCKLCETSTKISWKCLNCDLLMCEPCKARIHPNIKNAKKHKVVDIKEVGPQTEELDFSNIKCKEHVGQFSVMFCKSCDKPVCPLCIAKVHNGHGLVEIKEGYQIRVQKLQERQKEFKLNINKLSKKEIIAQEVREAERLKYEHLRKDIQAQNTSLKKAIDQYTEKLLKELDQKWGILQNSIGRQEARVMALKKSTMAKERRAENCIRVNDVEQIFEESEEDENWRGDVEDHKELNYRPMSMFLPGQIEEHNVGSLQETSTKTSIKIMKEFTTDISNVLSTSPCLESLWISSKNELQKVKPVLKNLKVISRFNMPIYDMTITPSNDLLLVSDETVLQKISFHTGQLTDSCYNVNPLLSVSVHVTSDNQVVVGGRSPGKAFPATGRRVVILMDIDGKHRTVYEHDRDNKPIFTYPRLITSTQNGHICVIDRFSDDYTGRVVVLAQEGGIIDTYNGHSNINTKETPFQPVNIVTTPSDNVIVIDSNTQVLHILDSIGNLTRIFDTNDIGIAFPFSIAFTATGKCYIGCAQRKGGSEKAKVYDVSISGF